MLTDPVAYRGAVAEALMHEFGRSWHDAFETADAISPIYIVEGISPAAAAMLWTVYTTRRHAAAAASLDEEAQAESVERRQRVFPPGY